MGLPVSAKNIFPSNIQGLPTWYEIRVSEAGHMARREGVDVMVAMNPASYARDVAEVVPGGTLIYDSTRERDFGRDDIRSSASPAPGFAPITGSIRASGSFSRTWSISVR